MRKRIASILKNQKGTSLVEVLIAACIGVSVLVAFSLALPNASKNVVQNRQNWVATNLASSQIASIKGQPYAYLDPTETAFFGVGNPSCDCSDLDFSVLAPTLSQNAGTTFKVTSCVNYVSPGVGNTWTSQCPSVGDTGYKNILVRVDWVTGGVNHAITQEFSMTRS